MFENAKNIWKKVIAFFEMNKIFIEIISIVLVFLTLRALYVQNNEVIAQTDEMRTQTINSQEALKQDREFRRLEFIFKVNDTILGDQNNGIKAKIRDNKDITEKQNLVSWIDNFEVLPDLYHDKHLITPSELNIYFGSYITNTCNHKQVVQFMKETKDGHNGLKTLCYCLFPEKVKSREVYTTECK